MIGCTLSLLASCSLKEEVRVNKDNSVDRNLDFHLDKDAAQKLMSVAAMAGQGENMKLDSLGYAWNIMADSLKVKVERTPGAKASYTSWDTASQTGTIQFHLPTVAAYNDFATNTFSMPAEAEKSMPIGGMKKEQLQWHGKDTLYIQMDNSKEAAASGGQETQQAVGMLKMVLGLDALIQYKATYYLPKPAKSVIGQDVVLSEDKKSVFIAKSLDDAEGSNDVIKVVF